MDCVKVELGSGLEYWKKRLTYIATLYPLITAMALTELAILATSPANTRHLAYSVFASALLSLMLVLAAIPRMDCVLDYVKAVRGYHYFTYRHYLTRVVKIAILAYISGQVAFLPLFTLDIKQPQQLLVAASIVILYAVHLGIAFSRYVGIGPMYTFPLSDFIDVHREVRMCMARRNKQSLLWAYICWLTEGMDKETIRIVRCGKKQCPSHVELLTLIEIGLLFAVLIQLLSFVNFFWPS